MTLRKTAAIAALGFLTAVPGAFAQHPRGFTSAGIVTEVNDLKYPAVGGGFLVDLGRPWISAGAQGEALVSWPYLNARGAVFGQGNLMRAAALRPFVLGGYGIGEYSGPMFGAGLEFHPPDRRLGFRIAVEDYLVSPNRHSGTTTNHHVTFRAGLSF